MNHKRKGPKSTRAGCMMCKPYKAEFNKKVDRKRRNHIDMDEWFPTEKEEEIRKDAE